MIENDVIQFAKFNQGFFGFLKAININRDVQARSISRYDLEIVLRRVAGSTPEEMHLKCIGVTEILIRKLETPMQLALTIEDVRRSQLEGISYRVGESEENAFSFSCSEFVAQFCPTSLHTQD